MTFEFTENNVLFIDFGRNNKKRIRRGGKAVARKFLRPEKGKYKPKPLGPTGLRAPNWNNVNLQPFQKNFYREHPNVMNRLRVRQLLFCDCVCVRFVETL